MVMIITFTESTVDPYAHCISFFPQKLTREEPPESLIRSGDPAAQEVAGTVPSIHGGYGGR